VVEVNDELDVTLVGTASKVYAAELHGAFADALGNE
jgi:hypothetical protein